MAGHRSSQADTAARRLCIVTAHVAMSGLEEAHASDRAAGPQDLEVAHHVGAWYFVGA